MELNYSDQELLALKREHAPNATEAQFQLWLADCRNRNLVPLRDVILQIRGVREWDDEAKKKVYKKKAIYITSIGALRKIAQRTGQYAGQLPSVWLYLDSNGQPSIVSDVPLPADNSTELPAQPWAAKASVLRKGWEHPIVVPARFGAYAQSYKDSNDNVHLNSTWANRGPEQLEKCAEALALRKAFPEELGGLYIEEEIKDDEPAANPPSATAEPGTKTAAKTKSKRNSAPAPLPDQEQSSASAPAVADSTAPAPSTNIHGVDITDDDLPENLRPQAEPPSRGAAPPQEQKQTSQEQNSVAGLQTEDKPSADDKKRYGDKCREFSKVVGSDALRKFILKVTNTTDTRGLSKTQWASALLQLEAAASKGEPALKDLVSGF